MVTKSIKNIPDLYDIWLIDSYKKDSLDIKHNPTYRFNISKSDTNSYGSNRFQLVIRQNPFLKVHLLNFAASKESNEVGVNWATENESYNTIFSLERSTDGATYKSLFDLRSTGSGNYSFKDQKPGNVNAYRLKIRDVAGDTSYSSLVTIVFTNSSKGSNALVIYPNPASSLINIAINVPAIATVGSFNQSFQIPKDSILAPAQTYDIKIFTTTGHLIIFSHSLSTSWQGNVSGLLPGNYIIEVFNHANNIVLGKSMFIKI